MTVNIQQVLVEHQDIDALPEHGGRVCTCGNWSGPWTGYDFAGHIEEQLRPLIQQAKADALTEAAETLAGSSDTTHWDELAAAFKSENGGWLTPSQGAYLDGVENARDFLQARAASLRATT